MTDTAKKSCLTCSNLMMEHDVSTRYARQVGSPMCAKFDKPIGRREWAPHRDDAAFKVAADKIGKSCHGYNETPNSRPSRTYRVAFPIMDDDPQSDGDPAVQTCFSCKHYAGSDVVMAEWGWLTGACTLKGELIPENSTTFVGKNCGISQFGTPRTHLLGVTLLPEYDEDFFTPDLVSLFLSGNPYDPHTYETDKPLTPADKAQGIRAWKHITDKERPDYETKVYLPIYDIDRYDEATKSKVPQAGDDEHPEDFLDHGNYVYKIAVLWTELDETPAAWGPPGVGKTELGRHLAWVMQLPFERISITASTELDDLAGKMHFEAGKGTYYQYGRVPTAWQRPGVIMIDEPNVGQPDVWQFLRPLTDNSKQLVLDMNEGERITRHVDAYLIMAMNPAWDPRNVGTAVLGDADGSRLMHIGMELPPPQIEEQIIVTRCSHDNYEIPRPILKAVMKISEELRGLCEQGTLPITWGPRNNIKAARATRFFTMLDAYRIAVADFLEPQQAEMVLDVVRANTVTAPRS